MALLALPRWNRTKQQTTADLIERSGYLKQDLLAFVQEKQFHKPLQRTLRERFGQTLPDNEGEAGNFFDHFMLQRRLPDGRTVVEHFVEAHPELPEAERRMLLGWRDVVEGFFEVKRRDGEALIVVNLLDELTYRARSNLGAQAFAPMPAGCFLVARLVPVEDEWLISGFLSVYPAEQRDAVCGLAGDLARENRLLTFRNPEKLKLAWDFQRQERDAFIAFFGADLVVVPGRALVERMRECTRFRYYQVRDADGTSMAERAVLAYGADPGPVEMKLPAELCAADTVGIVFDEVDGLTLLVNFNRVQAVFADPDLVADRRHRKEVLCYLESPTVSPRVIQRLAERDVERASRLFARLLKQPAFCWERDGEAMLRRYKASYYQQPVTPRIVPLSSALAPWQRRPR
jgi:hypothetical protein